jgi:hypothetical protein
LAAPICDSQRESLVLQACEAVTQGWHYDGNTLSTIVRVDSHAVSQAIRVEVSRPGGSLASRAELDGFAGAIARLHSAYDIVNQIWPMVWSPDSFIKAWQTGDRQLRANFPSSMPQRKYLHSEYSKSITALSDDKFAKQMSRNGDEAPVPKRAEEYKTSVVFTHHRLMVFHPSSGPGRARDYFGIFRV